VVAQGAIKKKKKKEKNGLTTQRMTEKAMNTRLYNGK
jgi:hypothetical protein